ncbi:reverse transcriptase [Hamiltosporidium magnivora]|uniref:Reverse transcriptase n=1 Tax=Hamiltosporidium magnivora TaxID=148818 RepID=A0A4Q9L0F7_9MICR|nr:reverse transcriptase [Hamiltosporidium magnivora]
MASSTFSDFSEELLKSPKSNEVKKAQPNTTKSQPRIEIVKTTITSKLPCPFCFSYNTSYKGLGKNPRDPRTYCNNCRRSYSTKLGQNLQKVMNENQTLKNTKPENNPLEIRTELQQNRAINISSVEQTENITNLKLEQQKKLSRITKEQISLVISGLPIFPKNNYIFLHFTNIKPNRIRYYKLALRSLNENILKNISNLDFINENTLEVICKEDSKQEIIKTFEEFPAKYVNKHPDLNEDGLLNIKAIKERMKKISKREKLINIRLKRFATKINMLEGTKLIEFLRTTGIEAIDTCTYDNSKLPKTKANITIINTILETHKPEILAISETWRDELYYLHRDYRIIACKESVNVENRYSNTEGIIVVARRNTTGITLQGITNYGLTLKVSDYILVFIYKSPSDTTQQILNEVLNEYTNSKILIIGDYNLGNNIQYQQTVLDEHARFGLFEVDLNNTTYTHNNFNTTPDKIFSNFLIKPHIFPINHINHKLIIAEYSEEIATKTPKFNINLLKDRIISDKISRRIQELTIKNLNLIHNLPVKTKLELLHKIILQSVRIIEIRPHNTRTMHNPIISHIRRLREEARVQGNIVKYEELRKEVKRITKKAKRIDFPNFNLRYAALEACEIEKILNSYREYRNTPENPITLLNTFITDGNITEVNDTLRKIAEYHDNNDSQYTFNKTNKIIGITDDETANTIKLLKSGKSGGISGIRNEFLKLCPEIFIHELTTLYNQIIMTHEIPTSWKRHCITPIPKGEGDYRPISLIEKTRKLMEKIILSKISFNIRKQQAGFREKHSTLNHALFLDNLLRTSNGGMICVTLDIKRAYDTVDRSKLYEKLLKFQNLSLQDTQLIAALVENNQYTIKKSTSESFKTAVVGLPQGSIISPSLFNVFIDDIVSYIPRNLRKSILLYADDIIIFSPIVSELTDMINSIEHHAKDNNYILNQRKCFYNASSNTTVRVNGEIIEKQAPLKYLGYFFNLRCADTNQSLKNARRKAIQAAAILRNVMRRERFIQNTNIYRFILRAYCTYVRPHLDYPLYLLGANKTFVIALDIIQKAMIKYLFQLYFKTPTKIIYALFPIERMHQRTQRLIFRLTQRIYISDVSLLKEEFLIRNTKVFKFMREIHKNVLEDFYNIGNLENFENLEIFINYRENNNISTLEIKKIYEKIKKENLKINFEIFENNFLLKNYDFRNIECNKLKALLDIISHSEKREDINVIVHLLAEAHR